MSPSSLPCLKQLRFVVFLDYSLYALNSSPQLQEIVIIRQIKVVEPGAYEPPTRFHHNPNYVTDFKK